MRGRKSVQHMIAALLVIVMLIGSLPVMAFAQTGEAMKLTVSTGTAMPGETVTVTVSVDNNPGIASLKFNVAYDSALTLTGVTFDPAFGSMVTTPEPYVNPQPLSMISPLSDITANGVFATLTFAVAENLEDGYVANISITYDEDDIVNGNYDVVPLTVEAGTITVYRGIPGDIDGDRRVNPKDAIALFRYVSGWNEPVDVNALDVTGDGKVNPQDAIELFRYVSGWPGITLHYGTVVTHTHNLVMTEAKAATCTEDGNIAYWTCSGCSKYYSDAAATKEITYADTVQGASGHKAVVDAAVDPSCTETGLTEGSHCSVCNEVLVAQVEVGKINHTPGKQATCTENQTCTVCGEVLVSANGHIPGVAATCTEPQRCTVCQTALADATGHSLTYIPEKDPVDDTDAGNCAYWRCSVCQKCYLDEAATQEIALTDTAWDTYLVYFHDLENNTWTKKAYKQSDVVFLQDITPVEMAGYDFLGWHTDENFTDKNKITRIPAGTTGTLNLYANRTLHEYRVTLLGLGREESMTYNIKNGLVLTTPTWMKADVGGDVMIFSHWSDENGEEISNIPAGEARDRTLTANWIYKVNYIVSNPNKYTYMGGYQNESGTYSFIYEIGAIKNLVLDVQHYHLFEGFSAYSVADAQSYTVGAAQGTEVAQTISQIVASGTAKAEIETNTTTHTEGWEFGGEIKPEVEVKGVKASIISFSGSRSEVDGESHEKTNFLMQDNYEENGVEDELRSTVDYYSETSASRTITETLIPGVSPVGNYTWARMMNVKVYAIVTYNPYTGQNVFDIYSEPTEVFNGMYYTLPDELEGKVNVVSADPLDFEIPFASIPEMFYTVEYDANGGTGKMPKSIHELGRNNALWANTFAKPGYHFVGWKTSPEGEIATYTDKYNINDIAAAGETVKLYAHWDANTYQVQYDPNGGLGSMEASNHIYDEEKNLPANQFYRTGYDFLGWATKPNATSVEYKDGGLAKNLSSTSDPAKLYAVWGAKITLDANGGTSSVGSVTLTADGKYQGLPTSVSYSNSNYVFGGWYYGSTKITNGMNAVVAGSHTLKAKWVLIAWDGGTDFDGKIDITSDGWEEKKTTGLNKSDLLGINYNTLNITLTVRGERWNSIKWENRPIVEIYNANEQKIAGGLYLGIFPEDLEEHCITFSIPTSALLDDGRLWIRFDTDNKAWEMAWYAIVITASP